MKNLRPIVLVWLLLVAAIGCKPQQSELRKDVPKSIFISGQVFIVTQGRQNFKLGLAKISLFKRSQVEDYIREKKKLILPDLVGLYYAYKDKTYGDVLARVDAPNFASKINGFFDDLEENQPITSTKTDADGRFRLEIPSDKDVILFATARRSVGNETEYYTWVLSSDKWTDPLFLSNDNIFPVANIFEKDIALLQSLSAKEDAERAKENADWQKNADRKIEEELKKEPAYQFGK